MVLKWGICCTGFISQDFTSAFCEFSDSNNKITAVAARSEERAKHFAERFNIENHFGSYEKLALFSDVDIVYIGSIHSEHCKLTKLFLNNGKHVLVEKPMGMNSAETAEMINLAREKKLFLMEGVWSLCFPLYKKIREVANNGTIGELRHINASFQTKIGNVDRVLMKELGGGGLLDIGIYVLQFALWMFHDRKLIKATSNIQWKEDIDTHGTISLQFEKNGTAFLNYHTFVSGNTSASVYGDSGSIIIPQVFWSPEVVLINDQLDESLKLERRNNSFSYNFRNSWYLIHEIHHVSECITNGLLESDIHPLDASLKLSELMETLLKK